MYRNFFSLSELPFSISPDPKYLFMSERHREALTHLTYGLGEVGGFALLTGEVGTGKTTISRCLMEQLPDNTQAAFILNPTLSCQELLATLCDQLKIRYRKTGASLKSLTDKISEKLLKNHENDISTLLIIDEAQHLQPEVLEQLRLLTNLETNTKKLLQVILIGQPELQQLLQRRDLRQLAQRITARYHLMPLTKQELTQYIQHRLTVADCARPLFDKGALNKIHQLSQGVPRLTNLLCHSALMLAYNQNDSVVNKKTVIAAADRALGEDVTRKQDRVHYNGVLIFSTALSVAAFIALAGFWWGQTQAHVKDIAVIDSQERLTSTEERINDVELTKVAAVNNENKPLLDDAETQSEQTNTNAAKASINSSPRGTALVVAKKTTKVVDDSASNNLPVAEKLTNEQISEPVNDQTLVVSAKKNNLSHERKKDINYKVTEVAGVSSDLLARFQAAIDETSVGNSSNSQSTDYRLENSRDIYESSLNSNEDLTIRPLTQMPQQLQNALPSLQFEQHIYASDGQGWVNVNGRDRYEGDYIGDNLIVEKILPQQVILSFQGEKFSLPALTNW
ncbi:general secretion pathway protein GspA [Colwellia psychrerythraea]|uniref:General secretion pathway protein GspA n=1 Tax=Colwellia psychrerythraea TaxID=28229 RepID=A0A1Y5EEU2_COLPS|nr:general secretion pathway protein GspA [Colwellia psychrerythraea]